MRFVMRTIREDDTHPVVVHDASCRSVVGEGEGRIQEAESAEDLIRADRKFRVDQGETELPDYEIHTCAAKREERPEGSIVVFVYGDGHCNVYLRTSPSKQNRAEWVDYDLLETYSSIDMARQMWPKARFA